MKQKSLITSSELETRWTRKTLGGSF